MKLMLFTDGSVNTPLKIGYGAYLAISSLKLPLDSLQENIQLRRFEDTSSTKLELQTLLWALGEVKAPEIVAYSDSQNIMSLQSRRKRLEENDYRSKNGKLLNNHSLYREFFRITDRLNVELLKLTGHFSSNRKNEIDRIFSLVDKASRNALRASYPKP